MVEGRRRRRRGGWEQKAGSRDRAERGKCAFKWTADKVFLMRLNATTCHSAHGGMQNEAATQQHSSNNMSSNRSNSRRSSPCLDASNK